MDDLKLYSTVNSIIEAILFQEDLDLLSNSCNKNSLDKITNEPLERVSSIRHLGVITDSELNIFDHLNYVINKANKQLGFIKSHSKDFNNNETLRLLNMALVSLIIWYNSTIWYPIHAETITRLERIQHKFFKFASSQLKILRDCIKNNTRNPNIIDLPYLSSTELQDHPCIVEWANFFYFG